jgi:hypothetical protein
MVLATGTAEVGGWTTRELLSILDSLEGLEVVGADVGKAISSHTERWQSIPLTVPSRSCTDLR